MQGRALQDLWWSQIDDLDTSAGVKFLRRVAQHKVDSILSRSAGAGGELICVFIGGGVRAVSRDRLMCSNYPLVTGLSAIGLKLLRQEIVEDFGLAIITDSSEARGVQASLLICSSFSFTSKRHLSPPPATCGTEERCYVIPVVIHVCFAFLFVDHHLPVLMKLGAFVLADLKVTLLRRAAEHFLLLFVEPYWDDWSWTVARSIDSDMLVRIPACHCHRASVCLRAVPHLNVQSSVLSFRWTHRSTFLCRWRHLFQQTS